ncbi:MAG TPA: UDP-N-acetylmuramate dehydrogenase [Phycisphaerae bacterium]|nr:UDP-N-acetylmuramate dehydrogenase [Phycisphaerae bacterium]
MNLFDDLPADVCRRNVPLAPLTWFGLGGSAEYLIEPRTEEELAAVVRRCRENGVAVKLLGFGANVLVRDEGVQGVIVRLTAEAFTNTNYDGARVTAGAGVDLAKLVRNTVRRGLAGLETLAGIPGTVGGGIRMNCGGKYGEIGRAVHSVRVVSADGELYHREHDDLAFGYRRCDLGGDWVTSAEFRLRQIDPQDLVRRFREIWMFKQNTQPPIGTNCAGCIFRNPAGRPAGMLIEQAGLKGTRLGGAYVSDRHANFILADRGSKAADVIALIKLVANKVEERFGLQLEPEVEIW